MRYVRVQSVVAVRASCVRAGSSVGRMFIGNGAVVVKAGRCWVLPRAVRVILPRAT